MKSSLKLNKENASSNTSLCIVLKVSSMYAYIFHATITTNIA